MAAEPNQSREKLLSTWGNAALLESVQERGGVGICGGRNAGPEALELASQIGAEVASMGLVLVSGDAKGVDDAAQFGALGAGGDLISVLAEGLASWKPRRRYRPLLTGTNFAAVSQFASAEGWAVWRAMQRNYTIIDLSMAMVVLHAGTKGGTWEAGRACLQRKKPLLVACGGGVKSEGSTLLIENDGVPFESAKDLRRLIEQIQVGESVNARGEEQGALFPLP